MTAEEHDAELAKVFARRALVAQWLAHRQDYQKSWRKKRRELKEAA